MVKASGDFLQITVDGQVIFMRQSDRMINATQILKLSTLTESQRSTRRKALRGKSQVRILPARGTHGTKNTWIDIRQEEALCLELGLEDKLRPLLDCGMKPGTDKNDADRLLIANESEVPQSPFIEVVYNSLRLVIRRSDWTVEYRGTYIDLETLIESFRRQQLDRLVCGLLELRRTQNQQAADTRQNNIMFPATDKPVDKGFWIVDNLEIPKSGSSKDEDSFEEDNESSVDPDIMQLHVPPQPSLVMVLMTTIPTIITIMTRRCRDSRITIPERRLVNTGKRESHITRTETSSRGTQG